MLYDIFIDPFVQMVEMPDFLLQVLWEGFVTGILYALIALGFVLIFKASGVFNFAQGIMVVFAGLTLVGLYEHGIPAYLALLLTIVAMGVLAYGIERVVMRPLVNQPDIILLMATIGLTYFLIGFGEFVFGGEPKQMIAEQLGLPTGSTAFEMGERGLVILQHIDIAAAVIALGVCASDTSVRAMPCNVGTSVASARSSVANRSPARPAPDTVASMSPPFSRLGRASL